MRTGVVLWGALVAVAAGAAQAAGAGPHQAAPIPAGAAACGVVTVDGRPWEVFGLGLDCAQARRQVAGYLASGVEPAGMDCAASVLYCWGEGEDPDAPSRAISARPRPQTTGLVVRISGTRVNLGGYGGQEVLGAATARFGRPSVRRRIGRIGCDLRWGGIGLRIVFVNLGGEDPCSAAFGYAQNAVLTGRWRTGRGVAVGDRLTRLRARYPEAVRRSRLWWLVSAYTPIGEGGRYRVLAAVVRGGRVKALRVAIGSAGE